MRRKVLGALVGVLVLAGCSQAPAAPRSVDLGELQRQAIARTGVASPTVPAQQLSGPVGDVSASSSDIDAGTYEVGAACAGVGQLSVEWEVQAQSTTDYGQRAVPCGDAGVFVTALQVEADGTLITRIRGDAMAQGQAAYAILVTPPRNAAAEALLGEPSDRDVSSGAGGSGGTISFEGHYGPGRYGLSVACVGVGVLRVSVDRGTVGGFRYLTCTPDGAITQVDAETDDLLTITIGDAPWTTGFASYAYRLTRI